MIQYPKPNTSPDYRADEQECIDRAQRALEVAEVNLDTVAGLLNSHNAAGRATLFSDLIAAAEARVRVGQAWGDLACWKNTVGEPGAAGSSAVARVVILAPDDEHVVIEVDGAEVVSANHDAHGWSGMDAVVRAAVAVAEAAGLAVEDDR